MTVESIKHIKETRPLIPSTEEAGTEAGNAAVNGADGVAEYPKNPVVERGQDPELFWMNKYGNDDREDRLRVDIRSLYRHEHIAPETLIDRLYRVKEAPQSQMDLAGLFGNAIGMDELDKVEAYYSHADGWRNRLIQGDSLLVMTSLLEREGLAGKVQCIYIDPPYGIKYNKNWQMRLNSTHLGESGDDDLSGEPEQIKAFRDTWELGIHSYLSYLRDRLLVARDLLKPDGSCFVQISSENVHLVRCIMDEVFGSACQIAEILVKKKGSQKGDYVEPVNDYVLWYARTPKDVKGAKFRPLFERRGIDAETLTEFKYAELPDGTIFMVTDARTPEGDEFDYRLSPKRLFIDYPNARLFRANPLTSGGERKNQSLPYTYKGKTFTPGAGNCWKTTVRTESGSKPGMDVLAEMGRLIAGDGQLRFKSYLDDFGYQKISNWWDGLGGAGKPVFVVQTNIEIVKRCLLMTTDPGDLVVDPTCGSGTTAYVAEHWGRRWITIDTSRIALNIAKTRLMTATFPYYRLHDEEGKDIRQGFLYKSVPHIMLGTLANGEAVQDETLYDQPMPDGKVLRVSGPFTVETLQNFEPVSPEELDAPTPKAGELEQFEERVYEHLKTAGVKNGVRDECAVFTRIEPTNHGYLHAEGYYPSAKGERKAYLHIGPKFGTVSRQAVNEAVKECRARGDADWLIILGFQFESDIASQCVTTSMGSFEVTKARMGDDLMQDGLLKRDKKAASFVTIGEPDIRLHRDGDTATVEICGLDIYDPIKDEVKPRDVADIAYWMVDDDYDGSNFIVRQVFFCGSEKKEEFAEWKKGLSVLALASTKKRAENALGIEIDADAFARLYGFRSHPIPVDPNRKIAVRVISQFGEESTTVLLVERS